MAPPRPSRRTSRPRSVPPPRRPAALRRASSRAFRSRCTTTRRRLAPRLRLSSSAYAGMTNYQRILEIGDAPTPADAAIVGNEASVTRAAPVAARRGRHRRLGGGVPGRRRPCRLAAPYDGVAARTSWPEDDAAVAAARLSTDRTRLVHGIPTARRRRDIEDETRLLDCVERLMLETGYAAVTYRAVAAKAGVTSGLVQYYFPTLDDLFVAAIRRRSEQNLERLADALRDRRRPAPARAVGVQPGRVDRRRSPPSSSPSATTASRSGPRSQSSPSRFGGCSSTRSSGTG